MLVIVKVEFRSYDVGALVSVQVFGEVDESMVAVKLTAVSLHSPLAVVHRGGTSPRLVLTEPKGNLDSS